MSLLRKEPAQYGVVIEHDVEMKTRDGVILRADVYRPNAEGEFPAVLLRTPYDKSSRARTTAQLPAVQAASTGFVFVAQDIRGRFRSDGDWEPFSPETECPDGYDTVEWVASLPWCDGRVGMIGLSYESFLQFAAAVTHPPSLRAIAPHGSAFAPRGVMTPSAFSINWGAVMAANWIGDQAASGNPIDPEHMEAILGALRDPAGSAQHLPLLDHPLNRMGVPGEPFAWSLREDLVHGELPWHEVEVPALFVSGWWDVCINYGVEQFEAIRRSSASERAREETRFVFGPWIHGEPAALVQEWYFGVFAETEPSGIIANHIDFFRRHVAEDHGAPPLPLARYFVMGANDWRESDAWPPADTVETRLYLRPDGRLDREPPAADEPPDTYRYDPLDPVPGHGVRTMTRSGCPVGPVDQRRVETRPDVLVYTTPPFEDVTEVVGPVTCRLFFASSAVDTDIFAKLCVVQGSGISYNLVEGLVRAKWRRGGDEPQFLEPGAVNEYGLTLGPVAYRLKPGERLRLQVTSSCFPAYDRNMNTGNPPGVDATGVVADQAVHHTPDMPSYVSLRLR